MARIGIAVEQVGHGRWPAQECLPHGAGGEDTAQRHRGIGDPFGGSHQVGFYPELLVGEGRSQPPKAGNHLIKNQQDAMAVTDVAQPLQVALRRREYAPCPGNGLDDASRDRVTSVRLTDFLEVISEIIAVLGLATGKRVAVEQMRMPHVLGIGVERAELSLVQTDTANTEAAKVDAVVSLLPANQHPTLPLAPGLMIGQSDLQRGIDGF